MIYPIEALQERWQLILSLNPMTGVITGFRWALARHAAAARRAVRAQRAIAGLLFLVGLTVFRGFEPRFADTI